MGDTRQPLRTVLGSLEGESNPWVKQVQTFIKNLVYATQKKLLSDQVVF